MKIRQKFTVVFPIWVYKPGHKVARPWSTNHMNVLDVPPIFSSGLNASFPVVFPLC